MPVDSYQTTRRQFLQATGLTGLLKATPSVAQQETTKTNYAVTFSIKDRAYSDFTKRYWEQYNVDIVPMGIRVEGTLEAIREVYNELLAKQVIPNTSSLDQRLVQLCQQLSEDPNFLHTKFGSHVMQQGTGMLLLNYRHQSEDIWLSFVGVPKGVDGVELVALEGYKIVDVDKNLERAGNPSLEYWNGPGPDVHLKPVNEDDKTTIPRLDVSRIRSELLEAAKKQNLRWTPTGSP